MTAPSRSAGFMATARAAFPRACWNAVEEAAAYLAPSVDAAYGSNVQEVALSGEIVAIPNRINLAPLSLGEHSLAGQAALVARCLYTRSTDGWVRQRNLRAILGRPEPWTIPFVALLAGEYVVEIIEDMVAALPSFDAKGWSGFVRENRPLMRRLRARAVSYWNEYYRADYPDRSAYPGLVFLRQLETWAG